jgi:hypothetical protein
MDPKYVLEALLNIWDELPFLIGMEAWTDLFRQQIEPLLRKLQEARSEEEQLLAGADVVSAFAGHPMARRRLVQAVDHIRTERSATGSPREALPWERLLAIFESFIHPRTATRYTDVLAPRRIQRGKRGTVAVHLTTGPEATSRASQALDVQMGRSVDISLRALSPGLSALASIRRNLNHQVGNAL